MTNAPKASPRSDPRRRRRLLQCTAVFSLPVVFMILLVFATSIVTYGRVHQFDDWWSQRQSFQRVLGLKILGGARVLKSVTLERSMDPEKPDPAAIRLDVDRNTWDYLGSDVGSGLQQFVDASLIRDNVFHPVKLRLRGDTSVHWLTEKRSCTLKTRRSQLYKGYRRLGISCKTVLPQHVVARLAQEFDLLAPNAFVAPVYLNDRFLGIYRVLELIDESFLRRHGYLPGNVYRGDTAERGEYFKGIERSLFMNPYIWDRVASNDRPSAGLPDAIERLLEDINGGSVDDHRAVMARLDRGQVCNLLALMLLTGDLFHMSGVHNQLWYEDPSSALLRPIPIDVELRDLRSPPHRVNRFLRTVLRDPTVMEEALRILGDKIAGNAILRRAEELATDVYERYQTGFGYDELRRGAINAVGSPGEIIAQLANNIEIVEEWINESDVVFATGHDQQGWTILDIETRGYVGVDLERMAFDVVLPSGSEVKLLADTNRNGLRDDNDRVVETRLEPGDGSGAIVLQGPLALPAGMDTREPLIRPAPLHYRLFMRVFAPGSTTVVSLSKLRPVLANRVTHQAVRAVAAPAGTLVSNTTSGHPWDAPAPRPAEIHLNGTRDLDSTLRVAAGDRLTIEPGTVLRLGPDVSILARGQVIARGEPDRPIVFQAASSGRPWGAVALLGAGASASVFEHCVFEAGGGALMDGVEFKGMVSIHWAEDVRFERCLFAGNLRCDDALNAVHAAVDVNQCQFRDANADAIDFDYSSGTIRANRIERSGNDAIDLMSCSPRIIANRISDSQDKGISVGEAAHPLVFNNDISECDVGIEIKDGSLPFVVHNTVVDNRLGISQIAKNWRYGAGGWAKLVHSVVRGNRENLQSDKHSRLTVAGCVIGEASDQEDLAEFCDPVLSAHGFACRSHQAGTTEWVDGSPRCMLIEQLFEDDFIDVSGGWTGRADLRKRQGALVVPTSGRRTLIRRDVDWDFPGERGPQPAVIFEFSSRSVRSVRVSVSGPGGQMFQATSGTGDLSRFRFIRLSLDPGVYDQVSIEIDPIDRTGRVHLGAMRLYGNGDTAPRRQIARSERVLAG